MPPPRPIESLSEAVGQTPTVRLARVAPNVVVKLECISPVGAGSDRVARALVGSPLPEGPLSLGDSGELALSVARELRRLGRPLRVVLPEDASAETQQSLEAWGAQVSRSPFSAGVDGARQAAAQLGAELSALAATAQRDAGHELGRELAPLLAAGVPLVVGFESIAGVEGLRAALPQVPLVAVAPSRVPSRQQGLAAWPGVAGVRAAHVRDEDAWAMRARLGREEGLLVSVASAAVVWTASQEAGHEVWCVAHGSGERSFSLAEQFE